MYNTCIEKNHFLSLTLSSLFAVVLMSPIVGMELASESRSFSQAAQPLTTSEQKALEHIRKLESDALQKLLQRNPHMRTNILETELSKVDLQPIFDKYPETRRIFNQGRIVLGLTSLGILYLGWVSSDKLISSLGLLGLATVCRSFPSQQQYIANITRNKETITALLNPKRSKRKVKRARTFKP